MATQTHNTCFVPTTTKGRKGQLKAAVKEAQEQKRGIWSLGDARISAAEEKRRRRIGSKDAATPALVFQ